MKPWTKTPTPSAPHLTSLVEVTDKALADLATALANDPEAARLRARVIEIAAKRAAAETELQRIRKVRAEYLDSRAAKMSVTAAANELLSADTPAGSMPVTDEAMADAHRAITVATEALRIAQDLITARSRVLAAQIADAVVRPAVRAAQRSAALYLSRAFEAYAQVFIANESLSHRGFGADPIGPVWKPLEVFGFPADMYGAVPRALREAIADGLLTEAEAIGDFPGAAIAVTGRMPAPALPAGYVPPTPTPHVPPPAPVRYREMFRGGFVRVPDEASILPD